MSGEGQYREQAKKHWEKLDAEGCKIINDLIVADKDRTIWPENTEPKFTGKERSKIDKSGIQHKKQTRKPYGFMQSCSVLLPSQIHMTKFTPHLDYFFQFNQRYGKN